MKKKTMPVIGCLMLTMLALDKSAAAEDPNDTYQYRDSCPGQPNQRDVWNLFTCNCTSYVAYKLNELWGFTDPEFTNQYYGVSQWSDARYWKNIAIKPAEIGVTGGKDNFTWEESSYNAVFHGDVAWWSEVSMGPVGHVAFVESATRDVSGQGVACVVVSEYNKVPFNFTRRTICKNDPSSGRFPDAFLHIDQDRIYCLAHPTVGNCPSLHAGQKVADGPGVKYGGLGGGSDTFNLKINNFWIVDSSGVTITGDSRSLRSGETVQVKSQVKAMNGNTEDHMRFGKSRIEVDLYVQEGANDWIFLKREYIQAANLPNGGTHTETVSYTVPIGVSQDISFKVKIDAEDEAYEANEGDNWSKVETFSPDSSAWMIPIMNYLLEN